MQTHRNKCSSFTFIPTQGQNLLYLLAHLVLMIQNARSSHMLLLFVGGKKTFIFFFSLPPRTTCALKCLRLNGRSALIPTCCRGSDKKVVHHDVNGQAVTIRNILLLMFGALMV